MTVSGPGRFSALMKERTQREAARLGTAATAGLIVLLLFAYRRWRVPVLAPLPLATAALAGLSAVGAVYGEVHGITLAFGFTLIGVAQDYPVHLFSHQHAGLSPLANARRLWPTLATGVAATCIAYLAFIASGVTGLEQLGLFSIVGLAAAGLSTRFLLPRIIGEDFRDPARSGALARLERRITLPRLSPVSYALAIAAGLGVVAWAPGPAWQDDLGALTPVPHALLAEDARLREALGTPDPRYFAVVTARDTEAALARLEALTPGLQGLAADRVIAGFEHAAKFLPSVERQQRRQARLPEPAALAAALAEASKGAPFRAGIFAPFLADVERARTRAPLTLAGIRGTAQAPLVEGLLHQGAGGTRAIIAFSGVSDAVRLRQWAAAAGAGMTFVDLKGEATALVVAQRHRILLCLALAAVLLLIVVRVALGGFARLARVVAPMALTTVAIVAVLRAFGTPLDLFQLMSLVLAAGLGIDYALFFERTGDDRVERLRTLHAVLVSSVSTLMVFALLSLSTIPVLRSIGLTVTLGVVMNFLLALSQSGRPAAHA
jgi:predicted exporter